MRPPGSALVPLLFVLLALGCGEDGTPTVVPTPTPAPTPAPTPTPGGVVIGAHTGPTEITFLSAEPSPGATIDGCGRDARGCSGRVRMRFRLLSASGGPVLDAIGFLHATNQLACYRGATGPLELQPGVAREIEVVFDQPDPVCGVPTSIAHMKVVLNAPVQTASLQEWAVRYELRP
jgi:hypothetical protein